MDGKKQIEIMMEAEKICNERYPQMKYCLSFDLDPKYEKACIQLEKTYTKCFDQTSADLKDKKNYYRVI